MRLCMTCQILPRKVTRWTCACGTSRGRKPDTRYQRGLVPWELNLAPPLPQRKTEPVDQTMGPDPDQAMFASIDLANPGHARP